MPETPTFHSRLNSQTAPHDDLAPLVFFSDVHLGAALLDDDAAREKKLIRFLESVFQEDASVYIVGDLFEFWFEYRETIPRKHFRLLSALHRFSLDGKNIHYLTGNHDSWAGSFFQREIGVNVHKDALKLAYNNFSIYLAHGDGLAFSDKNSRFYKRVFQNKMNIALYRWLHPDLGIPFAKRMSQVSRDKGAKPDIFAEEYRQFAIGKFRAGCNVFIMGHTHNAIHELIDGNHYINLGDWINHYSYCQIKGDRIGLYQWPSGKTYVKSQDAFRDEKVKK